MSSDQPRVLRNQWGVLEPPELGAWEPTLAVSVVVPAYEARETLPYTLASLAAQTYPAHLLEVVVVDDGSSPPLTLPESRPERTRLVRTTGSWGRAHACATGAEAAEGAVLHWFDADMVALPHEVEAQLRWHHLVDYAVVLGKKTFVDPAEGLPSLAELVAALGEDRVDGLFTDRWTSGHDWVEEFFARTDGLRTSRYRAYRAHTGATASVSRDLLLRAGSLDPALKLGEDIELGYRLQTAGAVFVADDDARSWHLGRTNVMQRQAETNRYNNPHFADRVPDLRYTRSNTSRTYTVPYAEVVVDAADHTYEEVRFTVDGVLGSQPHDLRVHLVGDWASLDDARRSPLADPALDLRLLHAEYSGETRVALVAAPPASSFPAGFRIDVPVGWAPGPETLLAVINLIQKRALGLLQALLPDGSVARFERVAAVERMRRLVKPGEDPDDVIDEVAGSWWAEGRELGFTHHSEHTDDERPPEPEVGRLSEGGRPDAVAAPADAPSPLLRRIAGRLRRATAG